MRDETIRATARGWQRGGEGVEHGTKHQWRDGVDRGSGGRDDEPRAVRRRGDDRLTIGAGALLLVFELAIIYKLLLSTRDFTRTIQSFEKAV